MNPEAYTEMFSIEDRHWWFVARRAILRKMLDRYCPADDGRKILEIGCGTGGNLGLLAEYGSVWAMELDDAAIGMARQRGGWPIKKGSLPRDVPFAEIFDLVCLLDVLEHIDDDRTSLKAVFDRLETNGTVLLTVPACKFLWSAHDRALHHKRRYRKAELIAKVVAAGFRVEYATYFNTFLFPIVAMVRTLHNWTGAKVDTDVVLPARGVNLVLRKIFAAEKSLLPHFSLPFGVSLLVVATRS